MKKWSLLMAGAACAMSMFSNVATADDNNKSNELYFYNWSEYIPSDVLEETKAVSLYAKSSISATELCIKAAKDGMASISHHGHRARSLRCNDLPVREFVKQFENTAI